MGSAVGNQNDSFNAGEWHGQICIFESSSDCNLEGGFEEDKTGRIYPSVRKNVMKDCQIGQKNEVTFPCLTNGYFHVVDRKGHVAGRVPVLLTGTSRWPPVIIPGCHCLENSRGLNFYLPDVQPRGDQVYTDKARTDQFKCCYSFKIRSITARWREVLMSSQLTHSPLDHPGKATG